MKYIGMPFAVWLLFCRSFEKNLPVFFDISKADAKFIMAKAKGKYKEIIGKLPEFEKGDRFRMNIVGCAMLAAVALNMPERPDVEKLTVYYRNSMMTAPMKWFCRMSGKRKFTQKDMDGMRKTAAFRAADRNPYSWNMDYLPYPDGSGYEARFTKCGICTLMQELGMFDLVVIDLIWWRNTKRIRFSFLPEKELYQSPDKHMGSFIRGIPLFAAVALLSAGVVTLLPPC